MIFLFCYLIYRHEKNIWKAISYGLGAKPFILTKSSEEDNAFCKACNCKILPRIASLKEHETSAKHQKNFKGFSGTPQESGHYTNLHIFLGNESCDLDSAVCSLVYAAFCHWQHERMKCRVCTSSKRVEAPPDEIYVAVLNVARADYDIKTEVKHCLLQHGVDAADLVFRDDLDLHARLSSPHCSVTLLDHHTLSARDAFLASFVREIIDHRPIDKSGWAFPAAARVTIEPVGSCASLVARRVGELSALFAERDDFWRTDRRFADLLHSAIILDTANFSAELRKGTPQDEVSASVLETILGSSDWATERARKLERLVSARLDVSALSCAQLLRKDAKVQGALLVPSLPFLAKEFLSREGALPALRALLRGGGRCCAVVLLGMDLSRGLWRDAAVYCEEAGMLEKLCAFLQAWSPSLSLESADASPDLSADKSLHYFTQSNLSATRKQYMPALKEFLKQHQG